MADQYTKQQLATVLRERAQGKWDAYSDDQVIDAATSIHPELKARLRADNPMGDVPVKMPDGSAVPLKDYQVSPTGGADKGFMRTMGEGLLGMNKLAMGAVGMAPLGELANLATVSQENPQGTLRPYVPTVSGAPEDFLNMVGSQIGEFGKGYAALRKGVRESSLTNSAPLQQGMLEALGHTGAGLLPGLGPMAAEAGEAFGQGRPGEGLAHTALIGGMLAAGAKGQKMSAAAEVKYKQKVADNLSSVLDEAGSGMIGPETLMQRDVVLPVLDTLRATAAREGVKPEMFKGREGYQTFQRVTGTMREQFDTTWKEHAIKPIENHPAPTVANAAADAYEAAMAKDVRFAELFRGEGAGSVVKRVADMIRQAETIGQFDEMRVDLNQQGGKYYQKAELAQYQSPLEQQAIAEGANFIREFEYPEIARAHAAQGNPVNPETFGEFQLRHGAAIRIDQIAARLAKRMDSIASTEGSTTPIWEVAKASIGRATLPSPAHAVGATAQGFLSPSKLRILNARLSQALTGQGLPKPVAAH